MTVGTLFTLFVVPVFYSLIAARHQQRRGLDRSRRTESRDSRSTGAAAAGTPFPAPRVEELT